MESALRILHDASQDLRAAVQALEPIFTHGNVPEYMVESTAVCVRALVRVSERHSTVEGLLREMNSLSSPSAPDSTCIEARGEPSEEQTSQNEEIPSGDVIPLDDLQETTQNEESTPNMHSRSIKAASQKQPRKKQAKSTPGPLELVRNSTDSQEATPDVQSDSIDPPSQKQHQIKQAKRAPAPPVPLSPERVRDTILSRGTHCLQQNTMRLLEYNHTQYRHKSMAESASEKTSEWQAFWNIQRSTTNPDDRTQKDETFLYWAYCIIFYRRSMDWTGAKKHLNKADWEKLLRRLELSEDLQKDWYEDKRLKRYRLNGRRLLNYSMLEENQAGDEGPLKGLSACIPTQKYSPREYTLKELQEANEENVSKSKSDLERALLAGPESSQIKRLLKWGAAIMDMMEEEGKDLSVEDVKATLQQRVRWLREEDLKFLDTNNPT